MSVRADNSNLDRCEATGKRRYSSQAKAHVHCAHIARANKRSGDRYPIHVYRCDACDGGWHIGHDSSYRPRVLKHLELKRK